MHSLGFGRELLRNGQYCSCAVIAHSVIPISEDSKSAVFRLLCEGCRNVRNDEENELDGDVLCEEIVGSMLKSLSIDNLRLSELEGRLRHSLSASYIHALCKEEHRCAHVSYEKTLNVVEPVPLADLLFTRDMKIYGLFLGLFTTLYVIGKRKIAAVIAVLLSRIDIACLCLNRSPLCEDDNSRLFRFCVGTTEDKIFIPKGTEALMSLLDIEIKKSREEFTMIESKFVVRIVEVFRGV